MKDKKTFHLYTDEEKLKIIRDYMDSHISIRQCANKHNISATSLVMWLRAFRLKGEDGLKSQIGKHRGSNKGRPKGSFKPKTTIEELERENLKLRIENERLKKGYLTKGVGAKREFISINNRNFKSLKD
jgi:transposase-like protein